MEQATQSAVSDRLLENQVRLSEATARYLKEVRDKLTLEDSIDIYSLTTIKEQHPLIAWVCLK